MKRFFSTLLTAAITVSLLATSVYAAQPTDIEPIPSAYLAIMDELSEEYGFEISYNPQYATEDYKTLTPEEFRETMKDGIEASKRATQIAIEESLKAEKDEFIPKSTVMTARYTTVAIIGDAYFDGGYLHCTGTKWNPQGYWQFLSLHQNIPYTNANSVGNIFLVDSIVPKLVDGGRTYSFTCTGTGYNRLGMVIETGGVRYTSWSC